jgi:hypothetical protein
MAIVFQKIILKPNLESRIQPLRIRLKPAKASTSFKNII